MTLIVEESEECSFELLSVLLKSVKRDNQVLFSSIYFSLWIIWALFSSCIYFLLGFSECFSPFMGVGAESLEELCWHTRIWYSQSSQFHGNCIKWICRNCCFNMSSDPENRQCGRCSSFSFFTYFHLCRYWNNICLEYMECYIFLQLLQILSYFDK